jgi:hypothetical protein
VPRLLQDHDGAPGLRPRAAPSTARTTC